MSRKNHSPGYLYKSGYDVYKYASSFVYPEEVIFNKEEYSPDTSVVVSPFFLDTRIYLVPKLPPDTIPETVIVLNWILI